MAQITNLIPFIVPSTVAQQLASTTKSTLHTQNDQSPSSMDINNNGAPVIITAPPE